jgi:hypothetical protein
MRDWLAGDEKRVVVVHCKAGKGRSGTASCSYLISEEGWSMEDAIGRFTERRMRPGFGSGVSIPSQLRWLRYITRWTVHGKKYMERRVEVCEIHVWGLRDGVTAAVRGFIDEGKTIKVWHTFTNEERQMMSGEVQGLGFAAAVLEMIGKESGTSKNDGKPKIDKAPATVNNSAKILSNESLVGSPAPKDRIPMTDGKSVAKTESQDENGSSSASSQYLDAQEQPSKTGADAIFKPRIPLVLDTNDINVDFERRTKGGAMTWSMTTSVAHVWFNTFFEGSGPEQDGLADNSGVFEIEWDKMDGIKGSSRKGTRAFDKISVVWRAVEHRGVIEEPKPGEKVESKEAADWRQQHETMESSDEEDNGIKPHRTQE